ncbi:MAG: hybrid sensor histidine kinase/response regulator [Pedobacter sp.]|nr:hybrid sensor histidine kinase/response regulator [Pedobacter sp.]
MNSPAAGPRPPDRHDLDHKLDELILREQAASLFSTVRSGTYSDIVVTLVFGLLMYWQTQQLVILPWIALRLFTLMRMPQKTAYFEQAVADKNLGHWINTYCRELRLNTALWGLAPILFLPDSIPLTSIMVLVIMAFCMGGVLAVAPLRRATYNLLLPMMLGLILGLLLRPNLLNLSLATFCVAFLIAVLRFAKAQHELLTTALRTRFEKAALAERLEEQMRATEQASQEKTRFLAAASHDLRQPLHAIALLGAALEKELTGRPEQSNASRLMRAVNVLRHSLDTMLDVSRLDAGVVVAARQPVALHPLFQSLNQGFVSTANEKDIQLRLRASPLWVESDPQLLHRLLSNLIDNAIKYTQHGGVLVVARLRRESSKRKTAEVWIEVYDSGIGIAPEQQTRVFEEFYQVGNHGRDRSLGLGIGLSIVKRLSLLLAHPVELRSVPGQGSSFRLRLPVAKPVSVSSFAADRTLPPQRLLAPLHLPRRVLVLDDEADVRDAMSLLLAAHGIAVQAVATAAEASMALQIATAAHDPFTLLICDFRLADGIDGLEVGQTLAQEFSGLRLLLVTGETAPERLQRVREAGIPVLFKPVSAERLLQAMA